MRNGIARWKIYSGEATMMVALISLLCTSAKAFEYSAYKEASFDEIIRIHEKDFSDTSVDYWFSAIPFKYKVRITFTRKLRKINVAKKEYIRNWAKALGQSVTFADLYKHEFLVVTGESKYWIPMQEPVLPFMGNELTVGDEFDLYIILAGKIKGEWTFLATEFQELNGKHAILPPSPPQAAPQQ